MKRWAILLGATVSSAATATIDGTAWAQQDAPPAQDNTRPAQDNTRPAQDNTHPGPGKEPTKSDDSPPGTGEGAGGSSRDPDGAGQAGEAEPGEDEGAETKPSEDGTDNADTINANGAEGSADSEKAPEEAKVGEGSLGTLDEPGTVTPEAVQQAEEGGDAATETGDDAGNPPPEHDEGSLGTLQEPGTTTLKAARPEQSLPARLGPAQIAITGSGDHLTLGMATQLRFDIDYAAAFDTEPEETTSGLSIRRLRTVLGSSFLDGKVRSSFQLNIAPSAFELIDMWVLYAPRKSLGIRVGQFKIPYTRYRAQSFAALSLIDWSPLTKMFGAERQIGVEFLNPAPVDFSVEYAVGAFTGTNARASHAVGLTEIYGDTPENPSNLRDASGPSTIHPELVGRVAKNFGAIDTSQNTDVGRGPVRQSIGLSGAWDARPVARQDLSGRLAFEWLLKWQGLYFNGIANIAWFQKSVSSTGRAVASWGWLAETGYRFNTHWELALRFTKICVSDALRRDALTYGTRQIGDGSDPAAIEQYALAGHVQKLNQLAVAGTYYIIGHSLKTQLGGDWQFSETDFGRQNELTATWQFQFQF